MNRVTLTSITKYLLYKQHLLSESKSESIIQITGDLCGLHATSPTTPFLSLFVRMNRFIKADLITEIETNRSLIRTRTIRNTLHILPVDRYLSVFAATRLQLEKRSEQYLTHLGMTIDEFKLIADKIMVALSGRGLTANELKKEIGHSALISHVINILCDESSIVRGTVNGGWKSNIHRYYRFEDIYEDIGSKTSGEENAFEDLVMSYIRSYGPVLDTDVIWWSGLKKSVVKDILKKKADNLKELIIPELSGHFIMLKDDLVSFRRFQTTGDNTIHFLPAMDPYIMGYKNRGRFINLAFYDYVYDRFGNAAPTIILQGEMIGIWDIEDENKLLKFYLFEQFGDEIYEKVIEAGVRIGKFYCDRDVDILEIRSVIPVKELTVGSFMSPLKNALKDV
jgi:hypothetical protein